MMRFSVGAQDIAYNRTKEISAINHVQARVFYPCRPNLSIPVSWLPHYKYANGFSLYLTRRPGQERTWKQYFMEHILGGLIFSVGSSKLLPVYYNAPLQNDQQKWPVVFFSHGIVGNRNTYSSICIKLASEGHVVVALEHADGSAAAVRLETPGQNPEWKLYQGIGDTAAMEAKTRYRVQELRTALSVLREAVAGQPNEHVKLSSGIGAHTFFKDRAETRRVAVVGHSYGGATAAAAIAEHSEFRVGVALDPWWTAVPTDSPAMTGWGTSSPLLVIGSHDWNIPDAEGKMKCNGKRQRQILEASVPKLVAGQERGGGALLLVPTGTVHSSFDDRDVLFGWIARYVQGMMTKTQVLPAKTALEITTWCTSCFISKHLPCGDSSGFAKPPSNGVETQPANSNSSLERNLNEEPASISRDYESYHQPSSNPKANDEMDMHDIASRSNGFIIRNSNSEDRHDGRGTVVQPGDEIPFVERFRKDAFALVEVASSPVIQNLPSNL